MSDNPYSVVGSPNYAVPLLDLFKQQQQKQPQQGQPQQPQPNGQQQPQQQRPTLAQLLYQKFFPQGAPQGSMQPGGYQPNGPMNIDPNATGNAVAGFDPSRIY